MTFDDFALLVKRLRRAQLTYFRHRSPDALFPATSQEVAPGKSRVQDVNLGLYAFPDWTVLDPVSARTALSRALTIPGSGESILSTCGSVEAGT